MERKVSGAIALMVLMIAFTGCAMTPSKYHGDWIGTRSDVKVDKQDAAYEYTLKVVKLQIDNSGRFNLVWEGVPYGGAALAKDDALELKFDSFFNRVLREDKRKSIGIPESVTVRLVDGKIKLQNLNGPTMPPVELERDRDAMLGEAKPKPPATQAEAPAPLPTDPPAPEGSPTPKTAPTNEKK